jgi:hypothetical protein
MTVAILCFKPGDIYLVGLRISTQNPSQVSCKSTEIQILDLTNISVLVLLYQTIVLALASITGKQRRVKKTKAGRNRAEKVQEM